MVVTTWRMAIQFESPIEAIRLDNHVLKIKSNNIFTKQIKSHI